MADVVYLKRGDGVIVKIEGDGMIHAFVEQSRQSYDHIETVGDVYRKVNMMEWNDPVLRDRIMGRLFTIPSFPHLFDKLSQMRKEKFEKVIEEFKEQLSYTLFPATTMESDREMERRSGIGYGGALMRSINHVPVPKSSYFQHQ